MRAEEGSMVVSTVKGAGVDFTVMNESSPLLVSLFLLRGLFVSVRR